MMVRLSVCVFWQDWSFFPLQTVTRSRRGITHVSVLSGFLLHSQQSSVGHMWCIIDALLLQQLYHTHSPITLPHINTPLYISAPCCPLSTTLSSCWCVSFCFYCIIILIIIVFMFIFIYLFIFVDLFSIFIYYYYCLLCFCFYLYIITCIYLFIYHCISSSSFIYLYIFVLYNVSIYYLFCLFYFYLL